MIFASRRLLVLLAMTLMLFLVGAVFFYLLSLPQIEVSDFIHNFPQLLKKQMHPVFFVLAMIILPLAGLPISIFLVLAGIRFGILPGMLMTFLILPLHMAFGFIFSRTFLREPLIRFLNRRNYKIPMLHATRPGLGMFGFLLMPGPPYILKTYLLAMSGLSFYRFLLVNWLTESVLLLPIVAMGGAAAQKNYVLFAIVLVIFLLSMSLRWFKRRQVEK